jgi:aspartate racemase
MRKKPMPIPRAAEGVVLSCTEIELLVTEVDSEVPLFPSTRLHVDAAVDWVMAHSGSDSR